MAWLRKTRGVPGSAPGGYAWASTEDTVEVPEDLAVALLQIPDAGFITVTAPEGGAAEDEEPVTRGPAKKTAAKTAAKTPVQE
jgi:hypothetical protein